MFGIVICAHANFAAGLKEAVEMVAGKQEHLETIGFHEGDDLMTLSGKIRSQVEAFEKQGLKSLVFTDFYAGTPFHAAAVALAESDTYIVTGANMPLLFECVTQRDDEDGLSAYLASVPECQKEATKVISIREMLA